MVSLLHVLTSFPLYCGDAVPHVTEPVVLEGTNLQNQANCPSSRNEAGNKADGCDPVRASNLLQRTQAQQAHARLLNWTHLDYMKMPWQEFLSETVDSGEVLVPHIVHQTYKSSQIPEPRQAFFQSWGQHGLESWQHILWTDETINDVLLKEYPWFNDTFHKLPKKIMQVDVSRAMMLHSRGGIYADLDIGLLQDPTPLLRKEPLTFFLSNPTVYAHDWVELALMSSAPKHPFWLFYLKEVQKWVEDIGPKEQHVFAVTGPKALTHTLWKYMQLHPDEKFAVYTWKDWHPGSFNRTEFKVLPPLEACRAAFPYAYMCHHADHSWGKLEASKPA